MRYRIVKLLSIVSIVLPQFALAEGGFLSDFEPVVKDGQIELTDADFAAARSRLGIDGGFGKEADENRLMLEVLEQNRGPITPIQVVKGDVMWNVVTSISANQRRLVVSGGGSYVLTALTEYLMSDGAPASVESLAIHRSVGVVSVPGPLNQQIATKVIFSAN